MLKYERSSEKGNHLSTCSLYSCGILVNGYQTLLVTSQKQVIFHHKIKDHIDRMTNICLDVLNQCAVQTPSLANTRYANSHSHNSSLGSLLPNEVQLEWCLIRSPLKSSRFKAQLTESKRATLQSVSFYVTKSLDVTLGSSQTASLQQFPRICSREEFRDCGFTGDSVGFRSQNNARQRESECEFAGS